MTFALISRYTVLLPGIFLLMACGSETLTVHGSDGGVGVDGEANADAGAEIDASPFAVDCGGPYFMTEGETLAFSLDCEPSPVAISQWSLAAAPAFIAFDNNSGSLTVTPSLSDGQVVHLSLTSGEYTSEVEIQIADAFGNEANVAVTAPETYTHEYGLPVFFLSVAPTQDLYEPIAVVHGGHTYSAEGKLRGKSSLSYPQKSFTLHFSGELFEDPSHGFVGEKKIVLTSTFDDNSILRNRLTWSLWNALAPTVPVAHTSAVVFVAGKYHGIYTLSDHIDDELFESHGLPTGGNIYKAINHDANFKLTKAGGGSKTTLHDGYEKKHGMPETSFDDLEALVQFIATSSNDDFAQNLATTVSIPDYEAWYLLATFAALGDSGGKNSYHFHKTGTLWYCVPWDFNASFGQDWRTIRNSVEAVDHFEWANLLWTRMRQDSTLGAQLMQRYQTELTSGIFSEIKLINLYDKLEAEVSPGRFRQEQRWGAQYATYGNWDERNDFNDADEEALYVYDWLMARPAVVSDDLP